MINYVGYVCMYLVIHLQNRHSISYSVKHHACLLIALVYCKRPRGPKNTLLIFTLCGYRYSHVLADDMFTFEMVYIISFLTVWVFVKHTRY